MESRKINQAVMASFMADIMALKPGNVSIYSPGSGMVSDDFVRSAKLCTPILCDRNLSFGDRILESTKVTMAEVGCNTNLGMLLLFTPIIRAVELAGEVDVEILQHQIEGVVATVDERETEVVFIAIRTASPGGLGSSSRYDVAETPNCRLIEAMRFASGHDLIALQYSAGFVDVLTKGFNCIKYFVNHWGSTEWATVACYLMYLASFRDSHIMRKYDFDTAEKVRIKTKPIMLELFNSEHPESMKSKLLGYDYELKSDSINPGTSADLTAASILVYNVVKC